MLKTFSSLKIRTIGTKIKLAIILTGPIVTFNTRPSFFNLIYWLENQIPDF
jgi:hypothetical protein